MTFAQVYVFQANVQLSMRKLCLSTDHETKPATRLELQSRSGEIFISECSNTLSPIFRSIAELTICQIFLVVLPLRPTIT